MSTIFVRLHATVPWQYRQQTTPQVAGNMKVSFTKN